MDSLSLLLALTVVLLDNRKIDETLLHIKQGINS